MALCVHTPLAINRDWSVFETLNESVEFFEVRIFERATLGAWIHFKGLLEPGQSRLRFPEGEFVATEIVKVDRLVLKAHRTGLKMLDGFFGSVEGVEAVGSLDESGVIVRVKIHEDFAEGERFVEPTAVELDDDPHFLGDGRRTLVSGEVVDFLPGFIKHAEVDVAPGLFQPGRFVHESHLFGGANA